MLVRRRNGNSRKSSSPAVRHLLMDACEPRVLFTTWMVDPSGAGNFTTVSAALAGTSPVQDGDTVLVKPGTYAAQQIDQSGLYRYFISKSITLKSTDGAGSTFLTAPVGQDAVINTFKSNTTVEGFTISGPKTPVVLASAFTAAEIQNIVIKDNVIIPATDTSANSSGYGIYNIAATHSVIIGNTIGLSNTAGIDLIGNANNIVAYNTLQGTIHSSGITLQPGSDNNILVGNTIDHSNFDGINVQSSGNRIERNTITRSGVDGITIDTGRDNVIIGNIVTFELYDGRPSTPTGPGPGGTAGAGIWFEDHATNNYAIGNYVYNASENGFAVFKSNYNYIEGNETAGNNLGGVLLMPDGSTAAGDIPTGNVVTGHFSNGDLLPSILIDRAIDTEVSRGYYLGAASNNDSQGVKIYNNGSDVRIVGNIVRNTAYTFEYFNKASGVIEYRNRIVNSTNGTATDLSGVSVASDGGASLGGNYYSYATGVSGNPSTGSTPFDTETLAGHITFTDRYPFESESLGQSSAVTILSPLADTSMAPGSTRIIRWAAPAAITVDINLIDGNGAVVATIAADRANTGYYSWVVPSTIPAGNYRIAITPQNSANGAIGDAAISGSVSITSNGSDSILLVSPSLGATPSAGDTTRVVWYRPNDSTNPVNVQIQSGNGAWTTLASNVSGSYADVTLPGASPAARIRVVDAVTGASDTMDGTFAIQGNAEIVSAPSGTVAPGSDSYLTWNSPAGSASVKLEYLVNGQATKIVTSLPDFGRYTWSLPDVASSDSVTLRVTYFNSTGTQLGQVSTPAFNISGTASAVNFESGNQTVPPPPPPPATVDFSATATAKLKSTYIADGKTKVTVTVKVTNNGTAAFNSTLPIEVALSGSSTDDGSAAKVSVSPKVALKGKASKTFNVSVLLPSDRATGTYYLLARLNANGSVSESDTTNNTTNLIPINIQQPFVDLGVAFKPVATLPATTTKPRFVTVTLTNTGNVAASGTYALNLFRSDDGTLDTATDSLLATLSGKKFKIAANKSATVKIAIPKDATLANGTLFAALAATSTPAESGDALGNNTASAALTVS